MATRTPTGQLSQDFETLRQFFVRQRGQTLRTVLETAPIAMDQSASLEGLRNENVFIPLRLDDDGMDIRAMMWTYGVSAAPIDIELDIAIYQLDEEVDLNTIITELRGHSLAATAYQGVKLSLVPGSEQVVIAHFGGFANLPFPNALVYDNPVKLRGIRQRFLYIRCPQTQARFPIPVSGGHAGSLDPWYLRAYSSSMANGQQFPNPVRLDSNINVTPAFTLLSNEGLQRYFF